MRRRLWLPIAIAVIAPQPILAQQAMSHEEGLHRHLFAPEIVMRHQRDLRLTAQQREAIKDAVTALQTTVVELQWELMEANQQLAELLEREQVDASAALTRVDEVLEIEARIKRLHLQQLIRIKNTLTPDQQRTLHGLRSHEQMPHDPPEHMYDLAPTRLHHGGAGHL